MHILLAILKIIGIIILVILGLLLAITLMLLFVPLRYRAYISTGGDITETKDPNRIVARLETTFLRKLVRITVEMKQKKLRILVKAGWIVLMRRGEPEDDGQKGAGTDQENMAAEPEKPLITEAERTGDVDDTRRDDPVDVKRDDPVDVKDEESGELADLSAEESRFTDSPEEERLSAGIPEEESSGADIPAEKAESPGIPLQEDAGADRPAQRETAPDTLQERRTGGFRHLMESVRELVKRVTGQIRNFPDRVDAQAARIYQQAADQLFGMLDRVDAGFEAFSNKAESVRAKVDRFLPLVDWVSRGYYSWVLYKIKKMLSHFRVRRGKGYLRFGAGRPDLTGLVGGMLWTALPADGAAEPGPEKAAGSETGKELLLEADFYGLTLDADAMFSGNIRICHVAWVVLQAACRRDTWILLRKVRGKDPYAKRRRRFGRRRPGAGAAGKEDGKAA